jgi:hypothetical protein
MKAHDQPRINADSRGSEKGEGNGTGWLLLSVPSPFLALLNRRESTAN